MNWSRIISTMPSLQVGFLLIFFHVVKVTTVDERVCLRYEQFRDGILSGESWNWKWRLGKFEVKFCCKGYVNIGEGGNSKPPQCIPSCEPPCHSGSCTSPGYCECWKGYEKIRHNECMPSCELGCENGDCIAPNVCKCRNGYKKNIKPGLKEHESTCVPHCSKSCIHSYCSKPEECTCLEGYEVTNSSNICSPVCNECENGFCNEPNVCTCHEGYNITISSDVCSPVCTKECVNSYCRIPETCSCLDGYRKTNETNVCEPICSFKCINGYCSDPEVCTCFEGYRLENSSNFCSPICSENCSNGHCIVPYTCLCNDGYRMNNETTGENICSPECNEICINGYCSSPNMCSCHDGYQKTDSPNVCSPVCLRRCVNGICIAPNTCECNEGTMRNPFYPYFCFMAPFNSLNVRKSSLYWFHSVYHGGVINNNLETFRASLYDITLELHQDCSALNLSSSCTLHDCLNGECKGLLFYCLPKIIPEGVHLICSWNNSELVMAEEGSVNSFQTAPNRTQGADLHFTFLLPLHGPRKKNENCELCLCQKTVEDYYFGDILIMELVPCREEIQVSEDDFDGKLIPIIAMSLLLLLLISIAMSIAWKKLPKRTIADNVMEEESSDI